MIQINLFTKEKQTHRFKEWAYGCQEEEWGKGLVRECGMDVYTLLYLKKDDQQDLLQSRGNSGQCYVVAWMGREFGGEWIHVFVWLSPFAVRLKTITALLIGYAAAAAAKSRQWCPTLCIPIDGSPPGSPVPGILQARTLEWAAISFSNAWKWKVKVKSLSHVWLLATPWTAAYQAPPSTGFSGQEYWSGLPLPSPANWL